MVFDIPMIQILVLFSDFEGAKNIHVVYVLMWVFGGRWVCLTGVWHLDLDLDMVTSLYYTNDLDFGSLYLFQRCNEHTCPLVSDLGFGGFWRFLTMIWDLYLDLDMVTGLSSEFCLYLNFEGAKNIQVLYIIIRGCRGHWGFLIRVGMFISIWI